MVPEEDYKVTEAAKAFYQQLVDGNVDRSRLDPVLDSALNERLISALSSQLRAIGPPRWVFVARIRAERGEASVYQLVTNGGTLQLSFGVDVKNLIWDFLLAPEKTS